MPGRSLSCLVAVAVPAVAVVVAATATINALLLFSSLLCQPIHDRELCARCLDAAPWLDPQGATDADIDMALMLKAADIIARTGQASLGVVADVRVPPLMGEFVTRDVSAEVAIESGVIDELPTVAELLALERRQTPRAARSGGPSTSAPDMQAARLALENGEYGFAEFLAERGLVLRADLLGAWSHWITPEFEPRRLVRFVQRLQRRFVGLQHSQRRRTRCRLM